MPHDHSSSKQSRLRVRANPPGASTPSQKPLLRLLRAVGSWLEGTAWSWVWVTFSEAEGTTGHARLPALAQAPHCLLALRFLSLKGSLCPPNPLCPPYPLCPQFIRSLEMGGEWLVGGLPGGRQGSAVVCGSGAAAQWDEMHPHRSGVSYQPVLFALCRLLLAAFCITCCRTRASSPADRQPP